MTAIFTIDWENSHIPLPPYIDREDEALDREMYQTVYSRKTARWLLLRRDSTLRKSCCRVREKGIRTAYVTLHVGIGTFRPVKCDVVDHHAFRGVFGDAGKRGYDQRNEARRRSGNLSGHYVFEDAGERFSGGRYSAGGQRQYGYLYLSGYRFKVVDALITNFHLPKSTLLMLVSALYDREKMIGIYEEAVRQVSFLFLRRRDVYRIAASGVSHLFTGAVPTEQRHSDFVIFHLVI